MMSLIVGSSASGKSEFAEKRALDRYNQLKSSISAVSGGKLRYDFNGSLVYLATMINSDSETGERIDRHVARRLDKGFETLEVPYDLGEITDSSLPPNSVVLLECLSNLLANEMFSYPGERALQYDTVAEKLFNDIKTLRLRCHDLIIVSNNVFEDGIDYEGETAVYIKYLGELHRKLCAICDEVFEVVVGIPVNLRKRNLNAPEAEGHKKIRWVL